MLRSRFAVIVLTVFFSISLARLPEQPGLSVIDGGRGAIGNSPMIPAIFNLDSGFIVLETGGVSYYDAPVWGEDQVSTYFCGALLRLNQNRFSLSMTSLSALNLYNEKNISSSYGLSFLKIMHTGVTADYLVKSSEGDYIHGANTKFSAAIGNNAILGAFSYAIMNIGENEYDPTIREMTFMLRSRENIVGSQAISFKADDYLQGVRVEISFAFRILEIIDIGVSTVLKPFVFKAGVAFDIKSLKTSFAVSQHNALGMSKYVGLQYLPIE